MELFYRTAGAWITVFAVLVSDIVSIASATIEDDEALCSPQHVHLSLGPALDQVVVMWATNGMCDTQLQYSTSPWGLNQNAQGKSATLTDSNREGLHVIHRALIAGLQPSTTYYYRPSSNNIVSGPFYFKSPAVDQNAPHEFLVVGGMGQHWELQPTLISEALTGTYSLMLHLGGFTADFAENNGTMGDKFMRLLQPVAAYIPCMTSPGEHESDGGQFSNYRYRFSMPGSQWPMPRDGLWYSFNVGLVHFVSYSTEVCVGSDETLKKQQHDWLVQDLNKANEERTSRPWIVAFGHRPMYCSGWAAASSDCGKNASLVRNNLEELFYYYGVDLVLQSHEQLYERMYPAFKGVVLATNYTNPRAPVQIVAGSPAAPPVQPTTPAPPNGTQGANGNTTAAPSGEKAPPGDPSPTSSSSSSDAMRKPRSANTSTPAWSAFRVDNETRPGYGRLHVINSTHAQWEFRSGPGEAGLIDSLLLVQEVHGKFQLSDLPKDVSQEIDQHLVAAGGKPGVLNVDDPERDKQQMLSADVMQRIVIGSAFGGIIVLVFIVVIIMKLRSRGSKRVARRWDSMDYKYGKTKLYAPGNDDDFDDDKDDNDFEVDIPDGSMQTTKLINGK